MALRDWLAATATLATPATVGDQSGLCVATVATVAVATPANEPEIADPDTERRRVKALAMLDAEASRQIAVIAEAGTPAVVGVAIRGLAYGELEIPAERYDAFALLALMQTYGHA